MTVTHLFFLALLLAIVFDVVLILGIRRYRHRHHTRDVEAWSDGESINKHFEKPGTAIVTIIKESCLGKARMTIRSKISNYSKSPKFKKLLSFLTGIGLVIAGQYMMSRLTVINTLLPISEKLNTLYRIDVKNLDNVIVGSILILFGGIIFVLSTKDILIRKEESEPQEENISNDRLNLLPWVICIAGGGLLFAVLLMRLLWLDAVIVDNVIWMLSIGLFIIAAFWWDRNAGTPLRINLPLSEWVVLALLLVIGLLIGTYQLQDIPNSMMGDEGSFFETARSIALGNYRPSPFDLGVYSYPIFGSFWQAGILKLFGITLWGWRFASVLPSVLTIIPLYLLCRDLFSRRVGFISSLVLITSPYFLSFSRLGYNNSQSMLVVTLCVWLVFLGQKRESVFYLLIGGMATGLGFLTYTAGRLGIVIICLFFVSLFISKSIQKKRKQFLLIVVVPSIIGWALLALPHLVYSAQESLQMSRNKMLESLFFQANYASDLYEDDQLISFQEPITVDEHELFFSPNIYSKLIVRGITRSLLAFHHKDLISEHFISNSLAGPYAAVFYVLGGFFILGRLRQRNYLLIALWFASGLFFLSMINTYPPRHQHLVPIIPVMAVLIGLGVNVFTEQVFPQILPINEMNQYLHLGLTGVIVVLICVAGIREFFVVMPSIYRPNLEQIINWIGLHNSPNTNVVYLYEDTLDENWKPYLYRDLLGDHTFSSINSSYVQTGEFDLPSTSDIVIFYERMNASLITPVLLHALPNADNITFLDRDGQLIGNAVKHGDVIIPSPASFREGLVDVLTSPVIWILSPLILFIGYYLFRYGRNYPLLKLIYQIRPPRHASSLCEEVEIRPLDEIKDSAKDFPRKVKTSPVFFEFGFVIRFGFGKYIRKYESKSSFHFNKEKKLDEQEKNEQ